MLHLDPFMGVHMETISKNTFHGEDAGPVSNSWFMGELWHGAHLPLSHCFQNILGSAKVLGILRFHSCTKSALSQ